MWIHRDLQNSRVLVRRFIVKVGFKFKTTGPDVYIVGYCTKCIAAGELLC